MQTRERIYLPSVCRYTKPKQQELFLFYSEQEKQIQHRLSISSSFCRREKRRNLIICKCVFQNLFVVYTYCIN